MVSRFDNSMSSGQELMRMHRHAKHVGVIINSLYLKLPEATSVNNKKNPLMTETWTNGTFFGFLAKKSPRPPKNKKEISGKEVSRSNVPTFQIWNYITYYQLFNYCFTIWNVGTAFGTTSGSSKCLNQFQICFVLYINYLAFIWNVGTFL